MTVPILRGNSVALTGVDLCDTRAVFEAFHDRDIARNTLLPEGNHTLDDARAYIRNLKRLEKNGRGWFRAIRPSGDTRLAGLVMVHRICQYSRSADVAGWILKPYRRQGLMYESVRMSLQHAFGQLGMQRICARLFPHNLPSIAMLKKLGFTYEATMRSLYKRRNRWLDVAVYSLLQDEWHQSRNIESL